MLPWWFWTLLWIVLILATLLLLVLAGLRLFKQAMAVLETAGDAADHLGREFARPGVVVGYVERARTYPHGIEATHGEPDAIREQRDLGKAERVEARRILRVTRRNKRGQAQNMRDLNLF